MSEKLCHVQKKLCHVLATA